jgi:prephenate dehydrogenase
MPDLSGPVRIVGAGLIGTSIGLALSRKGLAVELRDPDGRAASTAEARAAGTCSGRLGEPQLVVVAVPPQHAGDVIAHQLRTTSAMVTDTASVKIQPLADLMAATRDIRRYVGGHPMAGSERSGPLAARGDLFLDAAWAITPHSAVDTVAADLVRQLVEACGARPVFLSPRDHDAAVGRVSHLPQLMSSLTAATLASARADHLQLAGQGVRDVTRIASSSPEMWAQIVRLNSQVLIDLLTQVATDLGALIQALEKDEPADIDSILRRGLAGAARIPGKHGASTEDNVPVVVAIADQPGHLARLITDVAASGANIEDVRIDHSLGRPTGHVEILVRRGTSQRLIEELTQRGWPVHQ